MNNKISYERKLRNNFGKIENGKRDFDEKRLIHLATVFNLDIEKLKTEFFSELFAKKLYQSECSIEALAVAEEKVKYYRENNVTQGKLKL